MMWMWMPLVKMVNSCYTYFTTVKKIFLKKINQWKQIQLLCLSDFFILNNIICQYIQPFILFYLIFYYTVDEKKNMVNFFLLSATWLHRIQVLTWY